MTFSLQRILESAVNWIDHSQAGACRHKFHNYISRIRILYSSRIRLEPTELHASVCSLFSVRSDWVHGGKIELGQFPVWRNRSWVTDWIRAHRRRAVTSAAFCDRVIWVLRSRDSNAYFCLKVGDKSRTDKITSRRLWIRKECNERWCTQKPITIITSNKNCPVGYMANSSTAKLRSLTVHHFTAAWVIFARRCSFMNFIVATGKANISAGKSITHRRSLYMWYHRAFHITYDT